MIHKYGEPRDFDVVDLLLENRNIQVKGIIGESEIRLIKAQEMIGTVSRFLMANKKLLLKTNDPHLNNTFANYRKGLPERQMIGFDSFSIEIRSAKPYRL